MTNSRGIKAGQEPGERAAAQALFERLRRQGVSQDRAITALAGLLATGIPLARLRSVGTFKSDDKTLRSLFETTPPEGA